MRWVKGTLSALIVGSALLIPSIASASPAAPASSIAKISWSITHTNVDGILVPGIYVNTKDAKVAWIPDVGIVVVDKDTALPKGSSYLSTDKK